MGIQEGLSPETASISFHWRHEGEQNIPSSFFEAEKEGEWLWPLHGFLLEGKLFLFFMTVRSPSRDPSGAIDEWRDLGALSFFDVYDWDLIVVENPEDDPREWVAKRPLRPDTEEVIVGASIVVLGGFVYAFGWRDRGGYLLRWRLSDVSNFELSRPEWWSGDSWGPDVSAATVVLPDVKTEFTVHFDEDVKAWCQTQVGGHIGEWIGQRWSSELTGPWSDLEEIFVPDELGRPGVMVYAAKSHPHLEGADQVITYASNGHDVDETLRDNSIYFPRFVRVMFKES